MVRSLLKMTMWWLTLNFKFQSLIYHPDVDFSFRCYRQHPNIYWLTKHLLINMNWRKIFPSQNHFLRVSVSFSACITKFYILPKRQRAFSQLLLFKEDVNKLKRALYNIFLMYILYNINTNWTLSFWARKFVFAFVKCLTNLL